MTDTKKDNDNTTNHNATRSDNATVKPGAEAMKTKERKGNEDEPVVQRFFTEDGTPVEPSTIPPKQTMGEPDLSARPDVHARVIPASQSDVRNESELDDKDKQ